jgi:hypothetical protein
MNYIWDMLIKAENAGIQKENITFKPAKVYSPYMELAFDELNSMFLEGSLEVEINPYYRFYDIFKNLFPPDLMEFDSLRNVLFDLLIHHLADTDAYMGMNKQEFYERFIRDDIKNDCFGIQVENRFNIFSEKEKQFLLNCIIRLYQLGESLQLLKEAIKGIFKKSSIYINTQDKDEILIYLGEKRNQIKHQKITFLLEFFLPVSYTIRIYWDKHFGIINVNETMKIDEIMLY